MLIVYIIIANNLYSFIKHQYRHMKLHTKKDTICIVIITIKYKIIKNTYHTFYILCMIIYACLRNLIEECHENIFLLFS